MKFKATDEQVKQIFCNAINASIPVGMRFLHATEEEYKSEDIEIYYGSGNYRILRADYYHGLMVKLSIEQTELDGDWNIHIPINEPNSEYQSWATKYPTKEALVNSVLG